MPSPAALRFGPFNLSTRERLLTRNGTPVDIGSRAMDVLIALAAKPGAVVSKDDLIATAWPGVVVTQGSLRFQITLLRKALGDGLDGARYISNVTGRGYSFVAPLVHEPAAPSESRSDDVDVSASLPAPLTELFGRADDIAAITARLASQRFVTIVGAGGVGKTSVAVQIGHEMREATPVAFIDLGALSDPSLVPTAIATVLHLSVRSADPTPGLLDYLADKPLLLILDNCEHVIDVAAALAARIARRAGDVHILATSREPLDVPGEHVFRLEPLASPPERADITAQQTLAYPATRLFIARALASGADLGSGDAFAPVVADICRRLDGLALAIELTARRVASFGLLQIAELLDQRLSLAWQGQRTALPRQQTLRATLAWSFELLAEREKQVLCQLPVFVGAFTLKAARQVVAAPGLTEADVVDAIASLTEKSLLAVDRSASPVRYRLLESTKDYALSESQRQLAGLALRHAVYARTQLEAAADGSGEATPDTGNARAALAWCFGPDGDRALGIGLAASAAPAFLAMSLLAECHRWAELALGELTPALRGTRAEMQLRAALGLSLMFTRGNTDEVRIALEQSLELAQSLGDAPSQVQLLGSLQIFHERIGAFHVSLRHAERSAAVAANSADATTISTAKAMLGLCRHLVGDQAGARALLQAAIATPRAAARSSSIDFGFDHRNRAGIALARTLWLQGQEQLAVEMARTTVLEAQAMDHPVTLCIALIWAVSVHLWAGDLDSAEADIDRFIACAARHSLGPYLAVGRGVKSDLAIRRGGEALQAVEVIRACRRELREARYELLSTDFQLTLTHGLLALARHDDALTEIDTAICDVRAQGDLFYLPELLRVRATVLSHLAADRAADAAADRAADAAADRAADAIACLHESLALSREQGALAWELRAALDLARAWAAADQPEKASALLADTMLGFDAGSTSVDLTAAAALLQELDSRQAAPA